MAELDKTGLAFIAGITAEGAVVVTKSVTDEVPSPVNAMFGGLKLQFDSGGKPEHIDGVRRAEPLKPLSEANFRIVDPDCPGGVMLIVVGFAVTVNVGGGIIFRAAVLLEVPRVAEMVTAISEATGLVVTGKFAVVLLKGTVTVEGRVATPELELDRVTTVPPEGAAEDNITVPCEAAPPVTVVGLRLRVESIIGGCTVIEAV